MSLYYGPTPPKAWIAAKVFCEYAISQVNRFIATQQTSRIPLPVAHAFAGNLLRAVSHLPAESKVSAKFKTAQEALIASTEPLLVETCGNDGRLEGEVSVALLDAALQTCKQVFAHALAEMHFHARKNYLTVSNDTTGKGFVDEWDSNTYVQPEDDPNAKITPWAQADEQIYRDVYKEGLLAWELNETQIYSALFFKGCYADHCDGWPVGDAQQSVQTEFQLLFPGPAQPQRQDAPIPHDA